MFDMSIDVMAAPYALQLEPESPDQPLKVWEGDVLHLARLQSAK
jgi:hypothetical protein